MSRTAKTAYLHFIGVFGLILGVFTGISVETNEGALEAAKWLYENASPEYVILKLGSRGALLYDGKEAKFIPCFKVNAIDSTAAGDTFTAALAHFYLQGIDIQNATHLAHCAAAISVSRVGAYTSIPTKAEVLAFAEAHPRR